MHHFIYPLQDTFITNTTVNLADKNFGLDEILQVGTKDVTNIFSVATRSFSYTEESASNFCVSSFTGTVTSGSLRGLAASITGSITSGTGSVAGVVFSSSIVLSGSNFSGSAGGFDGYVTGFSGSISTGIITGTYSISQSAKITETRKYLNRALLKFDLTEISSAIASGDITSASFNLQLNVAREENLPLTYTIYAYPISQSWTMGNGYLSDGGSSKGASWNFRDYYSGSSWATPGGTWYTSSVASQSFNYEVGDIKMDVTNIVNSWLSGTIQNQGIILISSEENNATGSDMGLYFFSENSNTIYQPRLDVGWDDSTWVTGSVTTGSVIISTIAAGYRGIVTNGSVGGTGASGSFIGIANYSTDVNYSASGLLSATGTGGNITANAVNGYFSGSITSSVITGQILDGAFSGSLFTSSVNGYQAIGTLSGSWASQSMIGNRFTASLPLQFDPNGYATTTGTYINGTAIGTFIISSSNSASFNGMFTDVGYQAGSLVNFQLSGTFYTSNYSWTSSIIYESSSILPVDFKVPFVTVIQNLQPTMRAGNIVRVNVFARQEFPFKNFQRHTQFTQFLTPLYLPTSSYYAIKDNETDQIVLDFDNYTKVSCDINGNYFLIDTTGLPQERYFKLLIKTEQSGSVYTFDHGDIFKIVR